MTHDDEDTEAKCAQCDSPIYLGRDAIRLQEGVIGNRGFVELETTLFCCEACLRQQFCSQELIQKDRRIP